MKLMYRMFSLFFLMEMFFCITYVDSADKFKLKPGAEGKICLDCHSDFEKKIGGKFVHTPVKSRDCRGCHNPHASTYDKMLSNSTKEICFTCHEEIIPKNAASTHKVVVEGNCVKCHDPHGSNNKFNLLKEGNDLCFDCHRKKGDEIKKFEFKHSPVEGNCLNCHNPHASVESAYLLKNKVPSICNDCHKTDSQAFVRQHMNYPVGGQKCNICHSVHGSNKAGLLYSNVHQPVSGKMCAQCHEDFNSKTPFATKKAGVELCKDCHSDMISQVLGKSHVHPALDDNNSCLNCHSPHATDQPKLLKDTMVEVCNNCHPDVIEKIITVKTKHAPVSEGTCTACHMPHSSESAFLLKTPTVIGLCGGCHDWQGHSTHPIGEKVFDPRDKTHTRTVDCLSCHEPHGNDFERMLRYKVQTELCTQCHQEKR
ncbi:MAG: cytochrome C [Candidatus Schekmanbacteria bacterium]|nr:cytochrome C [Candidatus Schekmanbacteria bacterium]